MTLRMLTELLGRAGPEVTVSQSAPALVPEFSSLPAPEAANSLSEG